MTYLLDTTVLSGTRKRQPAAGVAGWIAATPPDRLHVSVLTLGEIEQGILSWPGSRSSTPSPGKPSEKKRRAGPLPCVQVILSCPLAWCRVRD